MSATSRKRTLIWPLALALAAIAFVAAPAEAGASGTRASHPRPAIEPTPTPRGIFSGMGGWIAYGDSRGIWAMDPERPTDPEVRIQLSTHRGEPLAWSSDGSKLLILSQSQHALSVLDADGTETLLVDVDGRYHILSGGSFSPDGSEVVYSNVPWEAAASGIYVVDSDGGTPRLLLAASRRWIPSEDRSYRMWPYAATFSPDGTQIAYIDGLGDWGNSLRVMNVEGSGSRILLEGDDVMPSHIHHLVWSPDGRRLAFDSYRSHSVYVVGADGSALTVAIAGQNPHWSPDGSRIAYEGVGPSGTLYIADADGRHIQGFSDAGSSGPWYPLIHPGQDGAGVPAASEGLAGSGPSSAHVQPEQEVAGVPAASEGLTLTSTLLVVAALLILVAGAVLIRRRMGRDAREGSIDPKQPAER